MPKPKMTLPPFAALRAFHAAATHDRYRDAAESLGLTESAISHQVRRLEEFLQTALMDRSGRRPKLTDTGRRYLEPIQPAILQIRTATEALQREGRHSMKPRVPRIALWVFLAVLLFAPAAEANVMVPLIFASWLLMIPALIPIILIEAAILTATGARFWESLLAGSVGNVASTLVGIPLALIVDVVVGISTRFYHDDWSPDWRASAVGMALLIPFFLLSWWIEAPLVGWVLGEIPGMDMAVRDANLVTYAILAILVGGALCFAVVATAREAKKSRKEAVTEPDSNVQSGLDMVKSNAAEQEKTHAGIWS